MIPSDEQIILNIVSKVPTSKEKGHETWDLVTGYLFNLKDQKIWSKQLRTLTILMYNLSYVYYLVFCAYVRNNLLVSNKLGHSWLSSLRSISGAPEHKLCLFVIEQVTLSAICRNLNVDNRRSSVYDIKTFV